MRGVATSTANAAPATVTPGHYKGLTSQNENFEFDVTSSGTAVTHFVTGQINQSCSPGGSLYGGNLNFGSYTTGVSPDGSFKVDGPLQGWTVGENPADVHITITGHFAGAVAAGNLLLTTSFTDRGTHFSCSSNLQTWTVTRTS